MDIEAVIYLSSGQDVNVLSNNDALLHSKNNACSQDACITRELSGVALPHYYDDITMSDNEFFLQSDGDECPSLGKEHQVRLFNGFK